MKIGIMTFVHTGNYGAVLQAYAMQELLSSHGAESELIDYICPAIQKNHDPRMLLHKRGIKHKLALPLLYRVYACRLRRFFRFEKTYLRFSDTKYRRETVAQCLPQYDLFLTGSDQVWNPTLTDGDMSYFLDFVPDDRPKLSYAASMGNVHALRENQACLALISRLGRVLVRENEASAMLSAAGIEAAHVLDPTLMLSAEHWKRFVGARPMKQKYIFMYMPPSDAESMQRIRAYAKAHNLKVVAARKGIRPIRGARVYNTLSPKAFLTWLYHAELVIGGSFHGVCFSVLFEKPFWAFSSPRAELTGRIDDLLLLLGLTERKYTKGSELSASEIDYTAVQTRLTALRETSAAHLKQAIECR